MGFPLFLILLVAVYLLHCSSGRPAVPVTGVDRHAVTAESSILVLQVRSNASKYQSVSTSDAVAVLPLLQNSSLVHLLLRESCARTAGLSALATELFGEQWRSASPGILAAFHCLPRGLECSRVYTHTISGEIRVGGIPVEAGSG